ncbi:MAG: alcohol dehydrogenase catalytic domain-containing protein [Thermodesulfobacteriota bacterium]|nr:alcohol dehydrogenase catalytic domain-containing protein [Thermodesulfobacteriota bacterium]
MNAVQYSASDGLVFVDVPMPELEKDQVLVRVINTGFCGSDHSLVENHGLDDNTILGHEVGGVVAAMGENVQGVESGTRVVIRPTFCGKCRQCRMSKPQLCQEGRRTIGIGDLPGGFAEYLKVYPSMLINVPDNVDMVNAAMAEPFATCLHAVNVTKAHGGSALIIGGGAIGLGLVMVLKKMGFGPIIISEPVESKRAVALEIGADMVTEPVSMMETIGDIRVDTVFECSGVPGNVQAGLDAVSIGGTVCIVSIIMQQVSIMPLVLNFKEVFLCGAYSNTHEENKKCLEWMADGLIDAKALISDHTALSGLPAIYRDRINTGRAVKVMVDVSEEDSHR